MLLPAPIKRKRRGSPKPAALLTPAPGTVTVVQVIVIDSGDAVWEFSGPASTDGSGNSAMVIDTPAGPDTPVATFAAGVNQIGAVYPSDQLDTSGGQAWHLHSAPSGIGFGAGSLVVPEDGVTTAGG